MAVGVRHLETDACWKYGDFDRVFNKREMDDWRRAFISCYQVVRRENDITSTFKDDDQSFSSWMYI